MGGIEYSHVDNLAHPGITGTRQYVGFWLRAGTLLIDALFVGMSESLLDVLFGIGDESAVVFVLVFAYYVLGTAWGATLGRYALGLRVVNSSGEAPGLARALVRTVVEAISTLALFIGYLWMLWDKDKQTWHDKAARTYVVRVDGGFYGGMRRWAK